MVTINTCVQSVLIWFTDEAFDFKQLSCILLHPYNPITASTICSVQTHLPLNLKIRNSVTRMSDIRNDTARKTNKEKSKERKINSLLYNMYTSCIAILFGRCWQLNGISTWQLSLKTMSPFHFNAKRVIIPWYFATFASYSKSLDFRKVNIVSVLPKQWSIWTLLKKQLQNFRNVSQVCLWQEAEKVPTFYLHSLVLYCCSFFIP